MNPMSRIQELHHEAMRLADQASDLLLRVYFGQLPRKKRRPLPAPPGAGQQG